VGTKIRAAFARYPHTARILSGELSVSGFDVTFEHADSIVLAYRAMAREAAYDVCEMAPVTYLAARAAGMPIVALPIFTFRRFHHSAVLCAADGDVHGPKDLEGRRVGVRAYSVTSAVWARGMWRHEYGVDLERLSWVTDDEENVATLALPPHARRLPPDSSLRDEFNAGRLDACFAGVSGFGRQGPPTNPWGTDAASRQQAGIVTRETRNLIPDWRRAEVDWYARAGIYPIHGMIVARTDIAQQHIELCEGLFEIFATAKTDYLAQLAERTDDELDADDRAARRNIEIVGPDPLPYGLAANAPAIDALLEYSSEQGLVARREPAKDLFLPIGE
jgi:4,5-dihydroxyphthalate decarboxylase